MNRSTRFLGLVLVLTALFLTTNCASQGDEQAVQGVYDEYRTAVTSADIPVLKRVLAEEKASELDTPRASTMLQTMGAMIPSSPVIREVSVRDKKATITLEGEFEGQTMQGSISFVMEEGLWKVENEHWEVNLGIGSGSGNWAARLKEGQHQQPRERLKWSGHEGSVTRLAFTRDGSRIVSIGYDDFRIKLWDRSSGSLLDEVEIERRPTDLAMLPRSDAAVVVDVHGNVNIWPIDYQGFGEPRLLSGDAGKQPRVAVNSDGTLLATTCWEGPVQLWDVKTGKVIDRLTGEERMRGISFSPRANILAAGHHTNRFTIWYLDAKWGKKKEVEIPRVSEQSDVWSVAISPDGKKLLTGHMDSSITMWDLEKRKEIHDLYVQDASAHDVGFSPDGTLFATAQQNGCVFLWDTETSAGLARMSGHQGAAKTVAFSPAEWELLASGGEDGTIILWQ